MSVEELKTEILRLNPEARANLAREILASLDAINEPEIEALWAEEAVRRDEELDNKDARAFQVDEIHRTIRNISMFPEAVSDNSGRIRNRTLLKFPYSLIYSLQPD